MTKKDWKIVEQRLKSIYGYVELLVDEYRVSLKLIQVSMTKNEIIVFVNGHLRSEWLFEDCEERRRFFSRHEKRLYTSSELKDVPRRYKKELEQKKYITYSAHWTSFRNLKNHLEANNKAIELVREGWIWPIA